MKNFLAVLISVNLVYQYSQVLSTPQHYTVSLIYGGVSKFSKELYCFGQNQIGIKGTSIWNNGYVNHVESQGVFAAAPALFFVKTSSDAETENMTNNSSSVCKESNGQFADPKYCDKYYDCWQGRPVSSNQCSHGLMFNEQSSSCDYPSMVNCEGKEINEPLQNVDKGCEQPYGKFADSRDCRKYTVCHAGIATYYTCEEGLGYDKDSDICAPPPDPNCLQGPPNDIPEGQDVPEVPLDPDTIKPVPPSGPSGGDDSVVFPVPDWPQVTKCPISTSGFVPVLNDCKSVIVCIEGRGYLLTCPSGNYYHPDVASCKPSKTDSCEQVNIFIANNPPGTRNNPSETRYGYFDSRFPLLPHKY